MDYYTVESMATCANGNIVLALSVSKIIGGTLIGPVHTILFRMAASGEVLQVAYFPVVHLAALVPLSNGNIAFRCSASDITWTGLGVMDAQLNWLWFKSAGLGVTPFLPNIMGQELAVSADETRLFAMFYTSGGEKNVLAFDLQGHFLQEEVYFAGPFAQLAATSPATGYARVAGIRADHFFMTRSGTDGQIFDACFFPALCHLQLDDTLLMPQPINWQSTPAMCLQTETLVSTNIALDVTDECIEIASANAGFQLSDTVICAGNTVNFKRNAGLDDPVFGTSEWLFEGAVPLRASGAAVENVRYAQSGTYPVRHIFNLAGCRDTAIQMITVATPPPITLGSDTTLCPGDTLLLQAGQIPGAEFIWSTGDMGPQLSVFNPGTYAVTVTDICTATDAIEVSLLSAAIIELGPDTLICPDAVIRLSSPPAAADYELRWSTGETGSQINVQSPGLYILRMSAGNCTFSDSIVVHAADCSECLVYAPNAFAPGSIRGGEIFRLYAGCPVLAGMLRIYDRWGNLLFESLDPAQGWDGRLNGRELPPGVYLFDAELQLAPVQRPLEWKRITGAVALVR
ncbi:MAG: gliding motility-associated C-terminal domain-containing protein [Saprospiraceae bacterium]|nr:gliding motility-associated C-terminal domain-containing protein [Saprospiraceae bacterium]